MATIKSFTSVEQSKKLAEILPLDSADMWYNISIIDKFGIDDYDEYPSFERNTGMDITCWSLAALLGIVCEVKRMDYSDKWEAASWNKSPAEQEYYVDVEGYDNPVDACVALIEKLHELNLL